MADNNHYVRKFSLTFALVITGISIFLSVSVIFLYSSLSYIAKVFW
jgi:hypothetical protein